MECAYGNWHERKQAKEQIKMNRYFWYSDLQNLLTESGFNHRTEVDQYLVKSISDHLKVGIEHGTAW